MLLIFIARLLAYLVRLLLTPPCAALSLPFLQYIHPLLRSQSFLSLPPSPSLPSSCDSSSSLSCLHSVLHTHLAHPNIPPASMSSLRSLLALTSLLAATGVSAQNISGAPTGNPSAASGQTFNQPTSSWTQWQPKPTYAYSRLPDMYLGETGNPDSNGYVVSAPDQVHRRTQLRVLTRCSPPVSFFPISHLKRVTTDASRERARGTPIRLARLPGSTPSMTFVSGVPLERVKRSALSRGGVSVA